MLVNIIIDIILVAIVVVGGFIGYICGFFVTVTKPVKWFLALLLAFLLCDVVATNIVVPMIEAPLTNQLSEYLTEKCGEMTQDSVSDEMPTLLKLAAGVVGVDITAFEGNDSAAIIAEIVDKLASPAINLFAVIVSFIVLYFVLKLLLGLLIKILDAIFSVGPIGVINSVLGMLFCAAFAFVMTWLLVILFGYIISVPAIAETEWAKEFTGGYVYRFFDSFTPLDLLLSF
jgi:hypothetical protein